MEDFDDPQKHEVAIRVTKELQQTNGGVVSTQVLAEFSNQVRTQLSANEINQRISDYQSSFSVVSYSTEEIKKANHLFETYKVHFFDALILATMNSNNIDTIITENEKDFKKVPGIKVINPFKKV
ncbi:PIN domain-containing protein [Candidatus Micrarchaeota archaeon]|nr:PIN domain-containing protein [Candidatus Micrarchaeota archaeon]